MFPTVNTLTLNGSYGLNFFQVWYIRISAALLQHNVSDQEEVGGMITDEVTPGGVTPGGVTKVTPSGAKSSTS